MWPFGRGGRSVDVSTLDLDGHWANAKIENEKANRPGFVRWNEGLAPIAAHPAYAHEAVFSIRYQAVRENGLPASKEELQAADRIEDHIRGALEADRTSLLAVVLTRDGLRDLIFYTRDPDRVIAWFEQLKRRPHELTHPVELNIRPDVEWELFHAFTGSAS